MYNLHHLLAGLCFESLVAYRIFRVGRGLTVGIGQTQNFEIRILKSTCSRDQFVRRYLRQLLLSLTILGNCSSQEYSHMSCSSICHRSSVRSPCKQCTVAIFVNGKMVFSFHYFRHIAVAMLFFLTNTSLIGLKQLLPLYRYLTGHIFHSGKYSAILHSTAYIATIRHL